MFYEQFPTPLRYEQSLVNHVDLDILRWDLLHPILSGNKWFKLKYYIEQCKENSCNRLATFGGAYSNHIVATAFAAKYYNIASVGYIRGEKPLRLSDTLSTASSLGMELRYLSRDAYKNKMQFANEDPGTYYIDEGGYGELGVKGIAEQFQNVIYQKYSHFVMAVGTGTTMAGVVSQLKLGQKAIGISALKGNFELDDKITSLIPNHISIGSYELIHDFHFGGYAKKTEELLDFINKVYSLVNLPLDFVYTAKAFYALNYMLQNQQIPKGSSVLFIHTGGLQGNHSLPKGRLIF